MRVTVDIEIEQLPPNQLLTFYQHIAVAEIGDRTFDVARSLTGLGFAVDEKVNGETLTHTFSINPVIEAVIERLREAGADDVRGCSCGQADFGAPGHDGGQH